MTETVTNLIPLISDVLRALIALVFCGVIIPWVVRYGVPWLKEKQLYDIVKKVVRAAEKLAESGTIGSEAKLDYVVSILQKRGIKVDAPVRCMIECAVGDLDDELMHGMMSLIDAINNADDASEFIYTKGKVRMYEGDSRVDDVDNTGNG